MAILETAAATITNLLAKSAGDEISKRMQAIRTKKDLQEMTNSYEAIINGLVQDRLDAIAAAQAYKQEVDRLEISDEDIEQLQNTIGRVLDLLGEIDKKQKAERRRLAVFMQAMGGKNTEEIEQPDQIEDFTKMANQIKSLFNADTLKAIQLLGFNYKEAIGDPLTRVCAHAIESKLGNFDGPQEQREAQTMDTGTGERHSK